MEIHENSHFKLKLNGKLRHVSKLVFNEKKRKVIISYSGFISYFYYQTDG